MTQMRTDLSQVGQGSVPRKRREPRQRVEDVAVTEASGLTLGPDGYPHPLETNESGELKVEGRGVEALLGDVLLELRLLRQGMVHAGAIEDIEDPGDVL